MGKVRMSRWRRPAGRWLAVSLMTAAFAAMTAMPVVAQQPGANGVEVSEYRIRSGDRLTISVWREDELQREVVVQPDGLLSFPLAGQIRAAGRTVAEIRNELETELSRYIPDLVVTVILEEIRGTRVYVLGQVNNAGQYVVQGDVDVMQALSLAGGMTAFASANDIRILRRTGNSQEAMQFRYNDVARGRNLEQNVLLSDGDVVVVP